MQKAMHLTCALALRFRGSTSSLVMEKTPTDLLGSRHGIKCLCLALSHCMQADSNLDGTPVHQQSNAAFNWDACSIGWIPGGDLSPCLQHTPSRAGFTWALHDLLRDSTQCLAVNTMFAQLTAPRCWVQSSWPSCFEVHRIGVASPPSLLWREAARIFGCSCLAMCLC